MAPPSMPVGPSALRVAPPRFNLRGFAEGKVEVDQPSEGEKLSHDLHHRRLVQLQNLRTEAERKSKQTLRALFSIRISGICFRDLIKSSEILSITLQEAISTAASLSPPLTETFTDRCSPWLKAIFSRIFVTIRSRHNRVQPPPVP